MSRKTKEEIALIYQQMQEYICKGLEEGDGQGKFIEDRWERSEGGGGRTRIFQDGAIIEKGGVAFSAVHGATPEKILQKLGLDQADFFATGVSIVLHPFSPKVPIIHMNIRYFEMETAYIGSVGELTLPPITSFLRMRPIFIKNSKKPAMLLIQSIIRSLKIGQTITFTSSTGTKHGV